VRVAFPLIAPDLYRDVNVRTAQLLGRWLERNFPRHHQVVICEFDDPSVRNAFDWVVIGPGSPLLLPASRTGARCGPLTQGHCGTR
jgi:hypothetical protein